MKPGRQPIGGEREPEPEPITKFDLAALIAKLPERVQRYIKEREVPKGVSEGDLLLQAILHLYVNRVPREQINETLQMEEESFRKIYDEAKETYERTAQGETIEQNLGWILLQRMDKRCIDIETYGRDDKEIEMRRAFNRNFWKLVDAKKGLCEFLEPRYRVDEGTLEQFSDQVLGAIAEKEREVEALEATSKKSIGWKIPRKDVIITRPIPIPVPIRVIPSKKVLELARSPDLMEKFDEYVARKVKKERLNCRLILLSGLSAYTQGQNVYLIGPTSSGKTWLIVEVLRLFPKNDVLILGGMTPKALYYSASEDLDGERRIVLWGKILSFLERPDPETLLMLRPLLSHDVEEYLYRTTVKVSGELTTMDIKIRGWPATFWATTEVALLPEMSTRSISSSPIQTKEKYQAGVRATLERALAPWMMKLPDPDGELLRQLILYLRSELLEKKTRIAIPYARWLADQLAPDVTVAREMRDIEKLKGLIEMVASFYIAQRPILEGEVSGELHRYIFATATDLAIATEIWADVEAETRESLPKHVRTFYEKYLWRKVPKAVADLQDEIYHAEDKATGRATLSRYLEKLENIGWVNSRQDPADKRRNLYKALVDPKTVRKVLKCTRSLFGGAFTFESFKEAIKEPIKLLTHPTLLQDTRHTPQKKIDDSVLKEMWRTITLVPPNMRTYFERLREELEEAEKTPEPPEKRTDTNGHISPELEEDMTIQQELSLGGEGFEEGVKHPRTPEPDIDWVEPEPSPRYVPEGEEAQPRREILSQTSRLSKDSLIEKSKKFSEEDQVVLDYIAKNPGCTKIAFADLSQPEYPDLRPGWIVDNELKPLGLVKEDAKGHFWVNNGDRVKEKNKHRATPAIATETTDETPATPDSCSEVADAQPDSNIVKILKWLAREQPGHLEGIPLSVMAKKTDDAKKLKDYLIEMYSDGYISMDNGMVRLADKGFRELHTLSKKDEDMESPRSHLGDESNGKQQDG